MSSAAPGWYDDGFGQHRWWDGFQWTAHVAPQLVVRRPINGVAITGFVLGVISVVVSLIPFVGPSLGLLASVFSLFGLWSTERRAGAGKVLAIWGLVLGGTVLLGWLTVSLISISTTEQNYGVSA